jgi:hypothetical protein
VIIFFQQGRFGNQLFQYSGLKILFPKAILFLVGFASLSKSVSNIDAIIYKQDSDLRVLVGKILRRLCHLLAELRIISIFTEMDGEVDYKICKKFGLFKGIIFYKVGYFQHEKICRELKKFPSIMPRIIHCPRVDKFLDESTFKASELVFVHIRRGDYLEWPTKEFAAALPLDWYLNKMDYLRRRLPRPLFLVCTDDVAFAKKNFITKEDVVISEFDEINDFYLMTKCQCGILSASSYAWWAGLLSNRKNPAGIFIAPKYWAGHKQGSWHPPKMFCDWIYYENV